MPSLGRQILNWLNRFLSKLGNKNAQERMLLEQARSLYANALNQTQSSFNAQTAAQQTARGGTQQRTNTLEAAWQEIYEAEELARQQLEAGEITEEAYDEAMDLLEAEKERLEGLSGSERQYSIEQLPDGKKYVRADRQVIFGNDPDSWSEQVEDYINGRIRRGQDVSLIAEDGEVLTITSKTAGKLADNHTSKGTTMTDDAFYLKANAAVHIDELAQVSTAVPGVLREDVDGRHGEFASGGWTYRTAFFQDFDGKYYRLRISAAKNSDGTIVYNIGDVKERSFPTINGSSVIDGALGGETSFKKTVPQDDSGVKQYSISDTASKQDVISGLKDILRRGGDIREVRQFVAQVERNAPTAKQNAPRADQNTREAEYILESAKRQGISVEEYLSQNWELYETETGWDPAARKALELEKDNSRQYSIRLTANMPYRTQLEQIENGRMNGSNSLYIGTPSVELQNAGFSSNPFAMNQGDYRKSRRSSAKNKNYSSHAVPYHFFENMPEYLSQAPMLVDNGTKVTMITSYPIQDTKGQDSFIVAGVWRDNPMESDTVNQAKSVYAWDDIVARITRTAEEGKLVVINENKAAEMLATIGVQPSEVSRILDLAKETLSQADVEVKQFSISDTQAETAEPEGLQLRAVDEESGDTDYEETESEEPGVRDSLPKKAQNYLKRAERQLLRDIAGVMNAHRFADRSYLQEVVREISDEYLTEGRISEESMDRLFMQAYSQGLVVDTEFYNQYKEVKDYLRTMSVTLDPRNYRDIADWQDFRRRAFGTLRIVNEGGIPVDTAYGELHTMAPELFPESIAQPADQLLHMYEVGKSITKSEKTLQEYHDVDARTYQKWAKQDFEGAVGDVIKELKAVKRFADEKAAYTLKQNLRPFGRRF